MYWTDHFDADNEEVSDSGPAGLLFPGSVRARLSELDPGRARTPQQYRRSCEGWMDSVGIAPEVNWSFGGSGSSWQDNKWNVSGLIPSPRGVWEDSGLAAVPSAAGAAGSLDTFGSTPDSVARVLVGQARLVDDIRIKRDMRIEDEIKGQVQAPEAYVVKMEPPGGVEGDSGLAAVPSVAGAAGSLDPTGSSSRATPSYTAIAAMTGSAVPKVPFKFPDDKELYSNPQRPYVVKDVSKRFPQIGGVQVRASQNLSDVKVPPRTIGWDVIVYVVPSEDGKLIQLGDAQYLPFKLTFNRGESEGCVLEPVIGGAAVPAPEPPAEANPKPKAKAKPPPFKYRPVPGDMAKHLEASRVRLEDLQARLDAEAASASSKPPPSEGS